MTSTPRGGAPRSLGASLLDAVLAETLDPAYAQAAAARAAGRPERPRWRGRALVALTMAIAGLIMAVTYNQAAAGAEGREQVREALIGDIDQESSVSDDLQDQLQDLSQEAASSSSRVLVTSSLRPCSWSWRSSLTEDSRSMSPISASRTCSRPSAPAAAWS